MFRDIAYSALITLLIFTAVPVIDWIAGRDPDRIELRAVKTAEVRLPEPPPPRTLPPPEPEPRPPKPELKPPPTRMPLASVIRIDVPSMSMAGDFDWHVDVPPIAEIGPDASIFDIDQLDQPPRPLARLKPLYPPHARLQRLEGSVTVEFIVDADGKTRDIEVVASSPGRLFVPAAVQAIRRWRFDPGKKEGRAVNARVRQTIVFELGASI